MKYKDLKYYILYYTKNQKVAECTVWVCDKNYKSILNELEISPLNKYYTDLDYFSLHCIFRPYDEVASIDFWQGNNSYVNIDQVVLTEDERIIKNIIE